MSESLDQNFWEKRYQSGETGWDLNEVSIPHKSYIDQLEGNQKILIPGCGFGHEYSYLIEKGFEDTYVVDIATQPLEALKAKFPEFESNIIQSDIYDFNDQFDLILEQTLFCAIDPELRSKYVEKMASLLRTGGKLVGVLFNFPLTEKGPPFGGSKEEYLSLFEPYFNIEILDICYNSSGDRPEYFIKMIKK